MAITALSIKLNRSHFSKYEPSRSVVTATVTATGTAGDQATITLRRTTLGAAVDLDSQVVTFTGSPIAPVTVSFDLKTYTDADGYATVRSSRREDDYHVIGDVDGSPLADVTFTVTPITAEAMKSDFLKGLPLTAAESLMVRLQPQAITGVTVKKVSPQSATGAGVLAFTAPSTLAWANGGAVNLIPGVTSYLLPDAQSGYLLVDVDAALLPGSSISETLYLEPEEITDEEIVSHVLAEMAALEASMQVHLEPTVVATERIRTPDLVYDVAGDSISYYPPPDRVRIVNIPLPYRVIQKVYELSAWFNRDKETTFGDDWQIQTTLGGGISLLPSSGSTLVILYNLQQLGVQALYRSHHYLPGFWQYHILSGLREIPIELRHFIGKRAAIDILGLAGNMRYPGGTTNESISRDGVSESRGLNPKGVYAALIDQYRTDTGMQDGKETLVPKLRQRYGGISVAVA